MDTGLLTKRRKVNHLPVINLNVWLVVYLRRPGNLGIILFGNPVSGVVLVFLTNHEHGIQILKSGILLFNGYEDYSTNNGKSGCERELEKW